MTIYDVKRLTQHTSPYFFDRKTLKFFHQKMSDFKVLKWDNDRFLIKAPAYSNIERTRVSHYTTRIFDPKTNQLLSVNV